MGAVTRVSEEGDGEGDGQDEEEEEDGEGEDEDEEEENCKIYYSGLHDICVFIRILVDGWWVVLSAAFNCLCISVSLFCLSLNMSVAVSLCCHSSFLFSATNTPLVPVGRVSQ